MDATSDDEYSMGPLFEYTKAPELLVKDRCMGCLLVRLFEKTVTIQLIVASDGPNPGPFSK